MNNTMQHKSNLGDLLLMQRFASFLNWKGLQQHRIQFSEAEIKKWGVPNILDTFITSDKKFCLQINELPKQTPHYQATIQASRYDIRNIGWHPFTLHRNQDKLKAEATRLQPWLDRSLYRNRQCRNHFKKQHPEYLVPSRKKLRRSLAN